MFFFAQCGYKDLISHPTDRLGSWREHKPVAHAHSTSITATTPPLPPKPSPQGSVLHRWRRSGRVKRLMAAERKSQGNERHNVPVASLPSPPPLSLHPSLPPSLFRSVPQGSSEDTMPPVQRPRDVRVSKSVGCSSWSVTFRQKWTECECGVLTEDTGTQSPAGEGDEAQLGIIKPSTVSVKRPSSQAGLVSPRQSCLDWDYTTQSPIAVFSDQRKKKTQIFQQLSSGYVSG
ncbi:hypothetical protein D9C73_006692 [Collichthys lucidus]|uniref:Uncharacterized protein n=1 Tax=Collichthys lucidus TaxID=240159 RepID=A0A4U5UGT5_COLLU|nr:hypothetical protein D9C73_006692 [Collichthys lucidus]